MSGDPHHDERDEPRDRSEPRARFDPETEAAFLKEWARRRSGPVAWLSLGLFINQLTWFGWVVFWQIVGRQLTGTSVYVVAGSFIASALSMLCVYSSRVWWRPPPMPELARDPNFSPWNAIGHLVASISLLLASFSMVYWQAAQDSAACFIPKVLTKIDAAYFTFTTFATAGFGDIRPVSQTCRGLVTGQIAIGLVILIVVVALAVSRAAAPRSAESGQNLGAPDA